MKDSVKVCLPIQISNKTLEVEFLKIGINCFSNGDNILYSRFAQTN